MPDDPCCASGQAAAMLEGSGDAFHRGSEAAQAFEAAAAGETGAEVVAAVEAAGWAAAVVGALPFLPLWAHPPPEPMFRYPAWPSLPFTGCPAPDPGPGPHPAWCTAPDPGGYPVPYPGGWPARHPASYPAGPPPHAAPQRPAYAAQAQQAGAGPAAMDPAMAAAAGPAASRCVASFHPARRPLGCSHPARPSRGPPCASEQCTAAGTPGLTPADRCSPIAVAFTAAAASILLLLLV